MSRKGEVNALRKALLKQDDVAEVCAVMARAGSCRTHICAQVMNDCRNRPCPRQGCTRHALNPEWLKEAQKLASLDRESSAEIQAVMALAAGTPRPCLFYGKAACFVLKRMVTEEELRTGIAKRPPPATAGSTSKKSTLAPTTRAAWARPSWADLSASDALSEVTQSSTAPPSDADDRSLRTLLTAETAEMETPGQERDEGHVALDQLEKQLEEARKREAALTEALAQTQASGERSKVLAEQAAPCEKTELKEQQTQTDQGQPQATLRDVLRILSAESTDPVRRIAFVLENYGQHMQ